MGEAGGEDDEETRADLGATASWVELDSVGSLEREMSSGVGVAVVIVGRSLAGGAGEGLRMAAASCCVVGAGFVSAAAGSAGGAGSRGVSERVDDMLQCVVQA
jgi:hypothetical protein